MVEVHPDPRKAKSDAAQTLSPEVYAAMVEQVGEYARVAGRTLPMPRVKA
jgi:3-deoxy-D-arabino-heptulosonate 7-phosphate (DAHP) synthase